jgi:hypothetical protein
MRFCRATLSQDRIKEIKRQCAEQFEKVTNKRREKRKNRDGAAVSAKLAAEFFEMDTAYEDIPSDVEGGASDLNKFNL